MVRVVGGAIGHEITTHKDLFWQHPICMGRLRGQGDLLVGMSHNVEVKRTVDRTKPEYHMVKEPVGSTANHPLQLPDFPNAHISEPVARRQPIHANEKLQPKLAAKGNGQFPGAVDAPAPGNRFSCLL